MKREHIEKEDGVSLAIEELKIGVMPENWLNEKEKKMEGLLGIRYLCNG